MKTETLYRQARAAHPTMKAEHALAAARRYIAGPLADYRAKLDAWSAEPDKRRYAPGGIANRPKVPEFYSEPRGLALREAEKPRYIEHDGWYADDQFNNTYRLRVWRLPHGRFLAGYESSEWGTVQLDRAAYDDEREAWRAADHMAERDAEAEREYSERWQEASRADSEREEAREELRDARKEARDAIRAARELSAAGVACDAIAQTRAILADKIASARRDMRRALRDIASASGRIAAVDMEGEF